MDAPLATAQRITQECKYLAPLCIRYLHGLSPEKKVFLAMLPTNGKGLVFNVLCVCSLGEKYRSKYPFNSETIYLLPSMFDKFFKGRFFHL